MRAAPAVRPIALAALAASIVLCALTAQRAAAAVSDALTAQRAAAAVSHNLSLYTRAEQGQFVDKSDDRTRGEGKNPFGDFSDTYSVSQSEARGPFPGDETSFTLNVYRDPALKSRVGIAVFFCQYNFAKDAFCDASFQLSGGTLLATGQLDFNATAFNLAVVGGTGSYQNVTVGTLAASPGALHAEHLIFQLQ